MKLSAILAPLIAAGVSGDVILATVKAFEDQQSDAIERRRESDRIRQHRRRHVTSRDVTVTERDTLPSDKENPPDPLKKLTTNQTSSLRSDVPAQAPSKPTPRSELLVVLDADHADAVIQHRQKIRKPITAHGAKLLAAKFAQCSNPNDAADAMIANGWQGFEPSWLDNRSGRQSQAPPFRERTVLDAVNDRLREEDAARYEHPTIDHEPITRPASSADIRLPATSQGRRW